jgi:hypothetical protein
LIQTELKASWVRRLRQEWERINWAWRLGLRAPDLAVHSGGPRLGEWRASERLISVREDHLADNAWSAVVETLKHEIAHQYVDEALGGSGAPHGPTFKSICARLGIGGAARGPAGADQDDSRIRRIRKLLALADGRASEHEAQSALATAHRLLLEYNLDVLDLERDPDYRSQVLEPSQARIQAWRRRLSGVLTESFFVEAIWIPQYDTQQDREVWALEIGGGGVNVDLAEYIWEFVARQGDRLWRSWRTEAGPQRPYARLQYLDGVVEGVARRLAADRASEAGTEALVWTGDPRLEDWFLRKHPRIRRLRWRGASRGEPRAAGVQAGEDLQIHRPIEAPEGPGGRLLTSGG